ncbi:hypothetical protein AB0I22_02350 [Streptomyces sp. NPDC050610]|uniref:hypothetical protein n=1 Tax=Streptomyces sp. NPDC050610 TaxID=3157097 RepID=UPI0034300B90
MSNPEVQRRPECSPLHDATSPLEPTSRTADSNESAPSANSVHVVINGAGSHVNITSAIAKDNSESKVGVGKEAADQRSPRTKRKIWAAIATVITVLGSIAGVLALFL